MAVDRRSLAVVAAAWAAFINLYSPQALLPELAHDFGVGPGAISALITAATTAIALTAPLTGALADVLGRKRLITGAMFAMVVPTLIMTAASTVPQLVALRFVQGLLVPPIFIVVIAYIGDEWPPAEVTRIAGLYAAGSSVGGFSGRFITGVIADLADWRAAFATTGLLTLAAAIFVSLTLTRERNFVRSPALRASLRQMLVHLRDPRLVAIYAVGFGVLFNFTAVFTYVSFHLAAPPYGFSPTLLGAIFVTYLAGSLLVPWIGRGVALFGRRRFVLGIIAVWMAGSLVLLVPHVSAIMTGLTLCAACGLLVQAVSTSYVITTATEGRSSAVGLYASIFYIGGSAGAFLTGFAWSAGGWDGCVAVIFLMQVVVAAVVAFAWEA